ncbi:MAG: glycosyltransferase family protein [Minisyncoccia bacterium]
MKQEGTHIIIQARMGSSRLPGKILMPFSGGLTFLEWVVERCKTSRIAGKVIVATTDSPKDDEIEKLCIDKGYDYVRGSESDVLMRYHLAAQTFGSKVLVRVTSDCPLVDIGEMDRAIEVLEQEGFDYVNTHPEGLPLGGGAEVFTAEAFEKVVAAAQDPYEHEHVTPYFYRHSELFKQKNIPPLNKHPFALHARLVLDYAEDREFLTRLAAGLGLSNPTAQPSTDGILDYLETHPELVEINAAMVQKTLPKA